MFGVAGDLRAPTSTVPIHGRPEIARYQIELRSHRQKGDPNTTISLKMARFKQTAKMQSARPEGLPYLRIGLCPGRP